MQAGSRSALDVLNDLGPSLGEMDLLARSVKPVLVPVHHGAKITDKGYVRCGDGFGVYNIKRVRWDLSVNSEVALKTLWRLLRQHSSLCLRGGLATAFVGIGRTRVLPDLTASTILQGW